MRTVSLAKIAAQAEVLRLRGQGRRTAIRVALILVASTFMTAALAAGHVAIVLALENQFQLINAVLIVGAGDIVIATVLGIAASIDRPGRLEREALEVKQKALLHLGEVIAVGALVGPALRLVGTRKVYGIALAALTARYLGGSR